jgi:hypothetical protein
VFFSGKILLPVSEPAQESAPQAEESATTQSDWPDPCPIVILTSEEEKKEYLEKGYPEECLWLPPQAPDSPQASTSKASRKRKPSSSSSATQAAESKPPTQKQTSKRPKRTTTKKPDTAATAASAALAATTPFVKQTDSAKKPVIKRVRFAEPEVTDSIKKSVNTPANNVLLGLAQATQIYPYTSSSASTSASAQGNSAAATASAASAKVISFVKERVNYQKRAYVLETMKKRGIDQSQFEALYASYSKYLEDQAKHKGFPSYFEYKLAQKDQEAREKGFLSYSAYVQDELDRQAKEKGFLAYAEHKQAQRNQQSQAARNPSDTKEVTDQTKEFVDTQAANTLLGLAQANQILVPSKTLLSRPAQLLPSPHATSSSSSSSSQQTFQEPISRLKSSDTTPSVAS